MVTAVLYLEMHFPGVTSLKGKRQIVQSIKANIRNRFNASVSEVEFHDKWQRAALGVAAVARERIPLETELNRIIDMVGERPDLEITKHIVTFYNHSEG